MESLAHVRDLAAQELQASAWYSIRSRPGFEPIPSETVNCSVLKYVVFSYTVIQYMRDVIA